MKPSEAMKACKMTVFKPARRTRYVMRWRDPATGEKREESTGKTSQRDAITIAGEQALKIVGGFTLEDPSWDDFCELFEQHVEARRQGRAREPWITARKWLEDAFKEKKTGIRKPQKLSEVTTRWVSAWQNRLRALGLAENTIASYSARLKIALRWADEHGLLEKAPKIEISVEEAPRSRAITLEEFERILAAARKLRPDDWPQWDRFLRGHWHSGFRISEFAQLSWDDRDPIHIEHRGRFPFVVVAARSNKKRKPRLRAITPEFWAVCCETPPGDRRGRVFPILNIASACRGQVGRQMSLGRIERQISRFGDAAGVITNTETGKTATSHDTRRGFAVQMDSKGLTLAELQKWMDHADIRTTLTYYRTAEADELAAKVWRNTAATSPSGASGGAGQVSPESGDDDETS